MKWTVHAWFCCFGCSGIKATPFLVEKGTEYRAAERSFTGSVLLTLVSKYEQVQQCKEMFREDVITEHLSPLGSRRALVASCLTCSTDTKFAQRFHSPCDELRFRKADASNCRNMLRSQQSCTRLCRKYMLQGKASPCKAVFCRNFFTNFNHTLSNT